MHRHDKLVLTSLIQHITLPISKFFFFTQMPKGRKEKGKSNKLESHKNKLRGRFFCLLNVLFMIEKKM